MGGAQPHLKTIDPAMSETKSTISKRQLILLFMTLCFIAIYNPTTSYSKDLSFPPDSYFQIAGIQINTTFSDIMKRFGPTPLLKNRRENSDDTICYYSSSPNDTTLVTFETGAMGAWERMISYTIYKNKDDYPLHSKCSPSHLISKKLNFVPNLYLDITKQHVINLLGTPQNAGKNYLVYSFHTFKKNWKSKTFLKNEEECDPNCIYLDSTMNFYFDEQNKLIYSLMSKTESN